MDTEVDFLRELCSGAFVIAVGGGATLGLELAARGVDGGSGLHRTGAGSTRPRSSSARRRWAEAHGVTGFGRALYGPMWNRRMTEASLETVRAEFAMFGEFEPRPLRVPSGTITLTHGEILPAPRHDAVHALAQALRTPARVLQGVSHAAHLEGGLPWSRPLLA